MDELSFYPENYKSFFPWLSKQRRNMEQWEMRTKLIHPLFYIFSSEILEKDISSLKFSYILYSIRYLYQRLDKIYLENSQTDLLNELNNYS